VPANVQAVAVSATEVTVTWNASTDNVGVAGYKINKNGNLFATISKTNYSDRGLSPATTYTYSVSAYDSKGNVSGQSAVAKAATAISSSIPSINSTVPKINIWSSRTPSTNSQFVPDVRAPTVPSNLMAQASSTSIINLSWSASKDNVGVVGYKIYQNGKLRGITTRTNYSDSGLSSGTTYRYYVSAYDAAGNASNSSSSSEAMTKEQSGISTYRNFQWN
jgi:chitodextrinase